MNSRTSLGPSKSSRKSFNLKLPTLGGKQVWTDHLHFHQWRIQQNVITQRWRLLDPKGIRYASGDFEHCRETLETIRRKQNLAPMTGDLVVVLHGLARTRFAMRSLCRYLEDHGYDVLNVSYASTRQTIGDHANALGHIIDHLPSAREINFVAHSMGNIVVRHYLADLENSNPLDSLKSKFHRMVMLGPPNHGSQLASRFHHWFIYRRIFGTGGQQLARGWPDTVRQLAVPFFEFGIIAGGQSGRITNPLIDGKDDFVVSVEETYLEGAKDFLVKPLVHRTMMDNKEVHQATLNFLKTGRFCGELERPMAEGS